MMTKELSVNGRAFETLTFVTITFSDATLSDINVV
jgi:hypothetical protein